MSKKECDGSCAKKALKKHKRKNVKDVRDVRNVREVTGVTNVTNVVGADPRVGPLPVGETPPVVPESIPEPAPESPARLLGRAVKDARKDLKLSRKELGRLIGVSKKQIILIEKNATEAELGTLVKVCRALSINLNISAELADQTINLG
jgi:DNA-binding XRE family transcriptional regulator